MDPPPLRSRLALDATNFFVSQLTGLAAPFLPDLLLGHGWSEGAIGVAAAMSALGVLLVQTPAGMVVDCVRPLRGLFAGSALAVGGCYLGVALAPGTAALVHPLLFASGIAQAFFAPLLGAFALGVAGHERLHRTLGANQAWNHAGGVAAALLALLLVSAGSVTLVFFAIAALAVLASIAASLIRAEDLDVERSCNGGPGARAPVRALLADRRVRVLLAASGLFHLANATLLPLTALRVKQLGGSDQQVAALVLVAQSVMIPVALAAGRIMGPLGRKRALAAAFLAGALGPLACALVRNADGLVAVQAFVGVGMGIFGVGIVVAAADMTRGKGRFNTLNGLAATVLALASVLGPLGGGFAYRELGYEGTCLALGILALAGALLFARRMPETSPAPVRGSVLRARRPQAILRPRGR